MQINSCMNFKIKIQEIINDALNAAKALKSRSKLRSHYIALVDVNNLFRAFVVVYELDNSYTEIQEKLLKVLTNIEARKNRAIFTNEHFIILEAIEKFKDILLSCDEDQFMQAVEIVKTYNDQAKFVISRKK